jgi:hypothetical protein
MPHYLGCLSLNPLVDQSVHDRVFFAVAAGVVPLSDSNAFSQAHMPMLEPYSFDFNRVRIVQAADALLSHPGDALERTEATWQALTPDFTMRRAAEQIMQFVALHGSNARCAA